MVKKVCEDVAGFDRTLHNLMHEGARLKIRHYAYFYPKASVHRCQQVLYQLFRGQFLAFGLDSAFS